MLSLYGYSSFLFGYKKAELNLLTLIYCHLTYRTLASFFAIFIKFPINNPQKKGKQDKTRLSIFSNKIER